MPLQLYVEEIEDYFEILMAKKELDHTAKNVLVATDEPHVIQELHDKFPSINWIGDLEHAKTSQLDNRQV